MEHSDSHATIADQSKSLQETEQKLWDSIKDIDALNYWLEVTYPTDFDVLTRTQHLENATWVTRNVRKSVTAVRTALKQALGVIFKGTGEDIKQEMFTEIDNAYTESSLKEDSLNRNTFLNEGDEFDE